MSGSPEMIGLTETAVAKQPIDMFVVAPRQNNHRLQTGPEARLRTSSPQVSIQNGKGPLVIAGLELGSSPGLKIAQGTVSC